MATTTIAPTTAKPEKRLMSAAEFYDYCCLHGFNYELVKGEVREVSPAGRTHGRIIARLGSRIQTHVETQRLGEVNIDVGYILETDPGYVRAPDIAFISAARLTPPEKRGFAALIPDLAVEVVSPTDSYGDLVEKAGQYFEAGVKEVWIVNDSTKSVEVFHTPDEARILHASDALETPLLPGLRIPVDEIFA